jgi:hypothetical protein
MRPYLLKRHAVRQTPAIPSSRHSVPQTVHVCLYIGRCKEGGDYTVYMGCIGRCIEREVSSVYILPVPAHPLHPRPLSGQQGPPAGQRSHPPYSGIVYSVIGLECYSVIGLECYSVIYSVMVYSVIMLKFYSV